MYNDSYTFTLIGDDLTTRTQNTQTTADNQALVPPSDWEKKHPPTSGFSLTCEWVQSASKPPPSNDLAAVTGVERPQLGVAVKHNTWVGTLFLSPFRARCYDGAQS